MIITITQLKYFMEAAFELGKNDGFQTDYEKLEAAAIKDLEGSLVNSKQGKIIRRCRCCKEITEYPYLPHCKDCVDDKLTENIKNGN